jgi:hypothetical protein
MNGPIWVGDLGTGPKISTVGTQSIARAQSIARRHTTYVIIAKKLKFGDLLFGKIKKEEFARRIFKKKSVFLPLKWLNKHFSNMTFFL